jgi:hypothetical protein
LSDKHQHTDLGLLVGFVAILVGCGQRSEDSSPSPPAPSEPAPAGPAFVQGTSIRKLDEHGTVTVVVEHFEQPLRMTTDRDERLWVCAGNVLTVYGGGGVRSVNLPGKRDATVAMARAAAGGVWVLQHNALVHVSESLEVTSYSPPNYEAGEQTRDGKFVDAVPSEMIGAPLSFDGRLLELDGAVWVAASAGLYRFSPAQNVWKRVRMGWFSTLVRDSNDMLWAIDNPPMRTLYHPMYLVGWNGASSFEVKLPEGTLDLAAGRNGRVFTRTIHSDDHGNVQSMVRVFTATRDGRLSWEPAWEDRRMSGGGPFTVDDNERVWTQSTDVDDIVVFDRAGRLLATLPYGLAYEITIAHGGPSVSSARSADEPVNRGWERRADEFK